MKKVFFYLASLILVIVGSVMTDSRTFISGERFDARKGGRIEISLVDGDPEHPIEIKAASKKFFRLQDEEKNQLVADLEPKPLAYFEEEYYYLNELHSSESNLTIIDGKAKIQFEISEVLGEEQEISIRYREPGWYKFVFGLTLFVIWIALAFILGMHDVMD